MTETPFSLRMTADILDAIEIPTGPFDPFASWEHQYAMWIVVTGPAGNSHRAGSLGLKRTTGREVRMEIDQITNLTAQRSLRTRGSATVGGNHLSTPSSWVLESQLYLQEKGLQETYSAFTGHWRAGTTTLRLPSQTRAFRTSRQMSSCWTLFDAVQRASAQTTPWRFDLLEEMELLRPRQTLITAEPAEARLNGRKVTLRRYEQTGTGILPITYWLDENNRLVMVFAGVRAFILIAGGNR